MRWAGRLLVPLAVVLATFPTVAAQVFVDGADELVEVAPGQEAVVPIQVSNPTDREYYFVAGVTWRLPGEAGIDPRQGTLAPRSAVTLNVTLRVGAAAEAGEHAAQVDFVVVDRQAGTTFERQVLLLVDVEHNRLFLFALPPPLPAPFNAGWGLFALEVATWAVLAVAATAVVSLALRGLGPAGGAEPRRRMSEGLHAPLALLLWLAGVDSSLRLPPPSGAVTALQKATNLAAIALAGWLLYRILKTALLRYAGRGRPGHRPRHDVLLPILQKMVAVVIVALLAVEALRIVGIDVTVLLAGGVVVGLVLSLAAQDTLSNLFSGIFILADQPFREGDEIRLSSGEVCRVDRIGLRSTRLFHFRHEQEMIVPNNSLASERVTNMSYPDATYRLVCSVEVTYSADLAMALRCLREAAERTPDILSGAGRDPAVWLKGFTDSGIRIEVRVYIPSSRHRNPVRTALLMEMKRALDANRIEISVPQRDVRLLPAAAQAGAE